VSSLIESCSDFERGVVELGVVGGVVLPCAPEDTDPGASEDARSARMSSEAGVRGRKRWPSVRRISASIPDEDRHPVLRLARTDGFAALAWRAASIIREGW